ncbi:MAG: cupredoxin domain-containing protein [Gaiellaceae bacterium]
MSVRRLSVALSVAAVLVGAGASSVLAGRAHTKTATVKVAASEFKFVLSAKSAPAGAVSFVVTNKGKLAHDFKIAGKKTALISPGKSATLKVTLKKGSYPYMCTVAGHAAAGMKGTFKAS